MSKKILIMFAAVLLVGISSSAFAAVENVKVGGDISIYGVYRRDFDFTKSNVVWPGTKDNAGWLATITRIYVSSELTDNVAVMVRFINERDWNFEGATINPEDTNIDLDLAYIQLTNMFVPGLTATIGRQEIILGEGFIVGDLNPFTSLVGAGDLSSRLSTDAIRLDYEVATIPLVLTGFVAKIAEGYAVATALPPFDVGIDVDLYGINVNYQVPTTEAEIEGYFVDLKNSHATKNVGRKFDYQTWGARGAHNVASVPGFSYRGEIALQRGVNNVLGVSGIDEKNQGMAGYIGAEYAFQDITWEPVVGLDYYYFSGDNKPADDKNNAWNPILPDAAGDRIGIIVDASGLPLGVGQQSNIQVIKFSGSIQPTEKLGISLSWFNDSLVKKMAPPVNDKKDLGNEIDLSLEYAYSEDMTMGLLFGYFIKGDFIKNAVEAVSGAGSSTNAMQVVGSVAVAF